MTALITAKLGCIGSLVSEGLGNKLLITFNESAPADYLDYVVVLRDIQCCACDTSLARHANWLELNDQVYSITCMGEAAWHNLCELGHATFVFDGAREPLSYGAIHVKAKSVPEIEHLTGFLKIRRANDENRSD